MDGSKPAGGITLRAAESRDIPAITRIYADAVTNGTASFELTSPDEAEMARRYAALTDNGYPYFVGELSGAIAGYAYAGPYRARPAYKWTVEDLIYVAPQFHRRGIGLVLLAHLIVESERRGFRQMIAVIGDWRRRRQLRCTRPPASSRSARSARSATSTVSGSTRR